MLLATRRRILGLLATGLGASRLLPVIPRAIAKTNDCFALQPFGQWKGVATNTQAGARISQIEFSNADACDLTGEISISSTFDGKLVVYGDADALPLPKDVLIRPDNRLILRNAAGAAIVDEPLCGTCNEIHDNKVTIILPLACGPLFRSERSVEMAVRFGDKEECRFTLNCEDLRKALDWAVERQGSLADEADAKTCTPPEGQCFITSACCELLGLPDDCFELRTLRRYRDQTLINLPGGAAAIAMYYEAAPAILARLPEGEHAARLLPVYARYILPCAIAAWLGWDPVVYRHYRRMMRELAQDFALAAPLP
jgi:hypothetical protein